MAANVSVVEVLEKPSSCSRPGTCWLPCQPGPYWPRAVVSANGSARRVAESTLIFSACNSAGEKLMGSSIAVKASSCSRWFWMTSRAAPMPS
ncbi:Uncharacterised protein [Mycobacteroides abscessus subsp. abscessus]|nr:Uncharacterised protein [Mycobacteroides abscessus subsp. abscessus]